MTRAAVLALAALAAAALLASRRPRPAPGAWQGPEDGIQPPDPYPYRVVSVRMGGTGTADASPGPSVIVRSDSLEALEPDAPYLEALPLARMRAAYGGLTQKGM